MENKKSLLRGITGWLAVLGFGLWVGGTLFNMLVIVPLWSNDPPASATAFFGTTQFSTTVLNFFGPPWMVTRVLPLAAYTVLSWSDRGKRKWLLLSLGSMIVIIGFTLLWIYPINDSLITQACRNRTPEEVKTLVHDWVWSDRLRFIIGTGGYLCLLRAFQLKDAAHNGH